MNFIFTDDLIKKRVASAIVYLGIRRVLTQVILTVSNIFVLRILTPDAFGAFAIVSFLVLTLGILTNLGLGPALVQKRGEVKKEHLRVVFTTLVLSSLIFVVLIYFLAPLVDFLYKGRLGENGVFWLRVFSFNLPLIQGALISTFLLERKLEYKKLSLGEVFVTLLTQVSLVTFAVRGLDIGSFVLANLVGKFASLIIFFYLSPWKIGLNFRFRDLKPYLPFGLNFQANNIIGAINGAVIPVFVGVVSGPASVGFINWASGLRQAGLAPFEVVEKIVFPSVSRLQDRKHLLKSLIERTLKISCMFSFPLMAAIFALAPTITNIVYTSKWLPGLTALYLLLIQGIFILLGAISIDVLLGLGHADKVRNISLFWASLQWILTVPLVLIWDFNGVVLAGLLVSSTFFVPLRMVRREVDIDIVPNVLPYLFYSILTGGFLFGLSKVFTIISIWQLIFVGLGGATFYFSIILFFKKEEIKRDLKRLRELVLPKR